MTDKYIQTYLYNHLTLDLECQNFEVMSDELPSIDGSPPSNVAAVIIHNQVIAQGSASSGKNAKVKAALKANEMLEGVDQAKYREDYGCDCKEVKAKQQAEGTDIPSNGSALQNVPPEHGTAM